MIWIVALQWILGPHAPVFLWLLVYSCLSSVAFEISPTQTNNNNLRQFTSALVWGRFHTSHVSRFLTYATNACMGLSLTICMLYQSCSWMHVATAMMCVVIIQILSVELIDFLKVQSEQHAREKNQSLREVAELYMELYQSAPDAFLSIKHVGSDNLTESFLDGFEVIHANQATKEMLGNCLGKSLNGLLSIPSQMEGIDAWVAKSNDYLQNLQKSSLDQLTKFLKKDDGQSEIIKSVFICNRHHKILTCSIHISKLTLPNSSIPAFNMIIQDMTQKYMN